MYFLVTPHYRETLTISISLEEDLSYTLIMPYIMMGNTVTPSFVELEVVRQDVFSENQNAILGNENINGTTFFKISAFGKQVNLTSTFTSAPFSRQNFTHLIMKHQFAANQEFNETFNVIPIFFNATDIFQFQNRPNSTATLVIEIGFEYAECRRQLTNPFIAHLVSGWNYYPIDKSFFKSVCTN